MSDTNINMDFSEAVIIEADKMPWTPSPLPGVDRRRLEREDAEAGRATSIVRYAPGSSFKAHTHGSGEEYFVLEGTFSDQQGDFGKGYYVRNPPGSSHAPFSKEGCIIFVKLCQMNVAGEPQVNRATANKNWTPGESDLHQLMPLFENEQESVRLEKLARGARLSLNTKDARQELLVLEGSIQFENKTYERLTWLRAPVGSQINITSETGCVLWSKQGNQ